MGVKYQGMEERNRAQGLLRKWLGQSVPRAEDHGNVDETSDKGVISLDPRVKVKPGTEGSYKGACEGFLGEGNLGM